MYQGFPVGFVAFLRCPADDAELDIAMPDHPGTHLVQAALQCRRCARRYSVENGIVRLLDASALDPESGREHRLRDEQAARYDAAAEESTWHRMEIEPTLEALGPLEGQTLLEIGCGTGRYTARIAPVAHSTLAVDFSVASLRALSQRAEPGWRLGLVQADVARLHVKPGSFDRALSTLVSNLPTAERRQRMMAVVATGLRPGGRFVFSTHHYSLRSRLNGLPRSGHYCAGGIYRYLFQRSEIARETGRFFRQVVCRPIQITVPFATSLGLPVLRVSRVAEKLPLLRTLGELLLVVAGGARESAMKTLARSGKNDFLQSPSQ